VFVAVTALCVRAAYCVWEHSFWEVMFDLHVCFPTPAVSELLSPPYLWCNMHINSAVSLLLQSPYLHTNEHINHRESINPVVPRFLAAHMSSMKDHGRIVS
jgi:hypothetical protein